MSFQPDPRFNRLWYINREIRLTPDVDTDVNKFVLEMGKPGQSIEYLVTNRHTNRGSAEYDIMVGKYGEEVVHLGLRRLGFQPADIDYGVREGVAKGWAPDVAYDSRHPQESKITIKSCSPKTISVAGQPSWTWEKTDPEFRTPKSSVIVALCYIDMGKEDYKLFAFAPWREIFPLLKPMKLEKYTDKLALYVEDIEIIKNLDHHP